MSKPTLSAYYCYILGQEGSTIIHALSEEKASRLLDGREWSEFPGIGEA